MSIHAILTDIEGTTSSIDFVHQTLFPYARQHLRAFLLQHAADPEVRAQLDAMAAATGRPLSVDDAASVLEHWIDEDRKATPLKALQGMVWRQGYAAGVLKGHVYPDAPEYLRRWHGDGLGLYVYSSGSVEAQKLIFGHTDFGDLTSLFSGYFDTRVGGKREKESYRAILTAIARDGPEVLFLSDIGAELDAASAAGLQTCQLLRDPTCAAVAGHAHARTFAEVVL